MQPDSERDLGGWRGGRWGPYGFPRPLILQNNCEGAEAAAGGGRGKRSKAALRAGRRLKTLGTGGEKRAPAVPPKLVGVTPPRGDPLAPPSRLPPDLDSPSSCRGPPQAAEKQRGPDTPKLSQRAPLSARPSAPPRRRSRRLAAAQGLALFSSASHSTPSPAAAPPLSPLTARRHFPRSSALNRKLAAQPAAAATAAATDSAAAAAAVSVEGLRRQRLEPRRGGLRDM